jgi:hypothetical protein
VGRVAGDCRGGAKAARAREVEVHRLPCVVDRRKSIDVGDEGIGADWHVKDVHRVGGERMASGRICVETREWIQSLKAHRQGNVRLELGGEWIDNRRRGKISRRPHRCWLGWVRRKGGCHRDRRARCKAGGTGYPHRYQNPLYLLVGESELRKALGGVRRGHGVEIAGCGGLGS